jgi:hypothetical protein
MRPGVTRRAVAVALLAALLAGCAGYSGFTLEPGRSTLAEVESVMGVPFERRAQPSGETWLYYPRQPFGREVYVARIGAGGALIAVEQRLNDETLAKIVRGSTTSEEVRNLLGPPYTATRMARMQRDVWEYYAHRHENRLWPTRLYVQFSYEGVVREVMQLDDYQDRPLFPGIGVSIGVGL